MKDWCCCLVGVVLLTGCGEQREQAGEPVPERPERPGRPPELRPAGSGPAGAMATAKFRQREPRAEVEAPEAVWVAEGVDAVTSPFTGDPIKVSPLLAGTYLLDPSFPPEEERIFRVPEPASGMTLMQAREVPGKEGFIFSPFNNRIIDVQGIPPGTMIADPAYPASEKKYFHLAITPVGIPIADREGWVRSPYDLTPVDVREFEAGAVIDDPSADPEQPRRFRVPGGEE